MSVLALDNASAGWGRCPVLEDITVSCDGGEILGLLGPNGAGKSTLLRLLAGDTPLLGGTARFAGRSLEDLPRQQRARCMAYLPQASSLDFPFTVREVVALGRLPYMTGRECDAALITRALQATDSLHLASRLYTLLSGGERQRVQLARVLCQLESDDAGTELQGKLFLLDEPTAALDLRHAQQLIALLRQLARRGCTIIVALHDINLLSSLCDRVMVIDRGQSVALGTPAEVFCEDFLESLYGTPVHVTPHPREGYPLVFPR